MGNLGGNSEKRLRKSLSLQRKAIRLDSSPGHSFQRLIEHSACCLAAKEFLVRTRDFEREPRSNTLNDFSISRLNAVSASRLKPRIQAPGVARDYRRLQPRYVSLQQILRDRLLRGESSSPAGQTSRSRSPSAPHPLRRDAPGSPAVRGRQAWMHFK